VGIEADARGSHDSPLCSTSLLGLARMIQFRGTSNPSAAAETDAMMTLAFRSTSLLRTPSYL
jgi:hypothetical protein